MPTSGSSDPSGSAATNAAAANTPASDPPTQVNYSGSYTVKTAPPVAAPALTTTLSDTCMGSVSLGFSLTGFGFSGGTTMVDQACVRRLDAREFRAMGMNDVALALLCQSDANRRAVEAAGHACPSAMPPAPPVASAKATEPAPVVATAVKPEESSQAELLPMNDQTDAYAGIPQPNYVQDSLASENIGINGLRSGH